MHIGYPADGLTDEFGEKAVRGSVSRWGNSLALRLPSALVDKLDLAEGSPVDIRVEDRSLVITPAKSRFSLQDLLAGYDPAKHRPGEADADGPVGQEAW